MSVNENGIREVESELIFINLSWRYMEKYILRVELEDRIKSLLSGKRRNMSIEIFVEI